MRINRIVATVLCCLVPYVSIAADNDYKVKYDGGSLGGVKFGSDIHVRIEQSHISLLKGKEELAKIPSNAVTEISYGQDVHRRIGAAIGIGVVTLGVGGSWPSLSPKSTT